MNFTVQPIHRRGLAVAALLLTFGAAACTSDDGTDGDGNATPSIASADNGPSSVGAPTTPHTDATQSGDTVSPDSALETSAPATESTAPAPVNTSVLDGLFARSLGPSNADAHARTEQLIAECMREEGFEYTPEPYQQRLSDAEIRQIARDTYGGYGLVASLPGRITITGADATPSAAPPLAPPTPAQSAADPNDEYLASLPAPDRSTYRVALDGFDASVASTAGDIDVGSDFDGGCRGRSTLAVNGVDPYSVPGVQERVAEILNSIDADPRVRKAIDAWTECVTAVVGEVGATAIRDVSLLEYVQSQVDAALGVQTIQSGETSSVVGEEHPITADEYQRLVDLELRVYDTDIACRMQAGVEAARTAVENEVGAQLIAEYPELAID
jgi:hypothetical protein